MLITLTYHCSMGCTHCLSDCKPDGQHMPYSVFEDALDFCNRHQISSMHLSGGEMFEHPEIGNFVEQRKKQGILSPVPCAWERLPWITAMGCSVPCWPINKSGKGTSWYGWRNTFHPASYAAAADTKIRSQRIFPSGRSAARNAARNMTGISMRPSTSTGKA